MWFPVAVSRVSYSWRESSWFLKSLCVSSARHRPDLPWTTAGCAPPRMTRLAQLAAAGSGGGGGSSGSSGGASAAATLAATSAAAVAAALLGGTVALCEVRCRAAQLHGQSICLAAAALAA